MCDRESHSPHASGLWRQSTGVGISAPGGSPGVAVRSSTMAVTTFIMYRSFLDLVFQCLVEVPVAPFPIEAHCRARLLTGPDAALDAFRVFGVALQRIVDLLLRIAPQRRARHTRRHDEAVDVSVVEHAVLRVGIARLFICTSRGDSMRRTSGGGFLSLAKTSCTLVPWRQWMTASMLNLHACGPADEVTTKRSGALCKYLHRSAPQWFFFFFQAIAAPSFAPS